MIAELLVIFVGLILRVREYIFNRSLWVDEAMLALNILERSWSGLLKPLDYNQAAPPLFLWIEKFISVILGNSELSLRLWPFLASSLAFIFFYFASKKILRKEGLLVALFIFAISDPVLFQTANLKQYTTDLMLATLFLYIFTVESKNRAFILLALLGVLGPWLSFPSLLIMFSLAIVYFIQKENPYKLAPLFFLWTVSTLMLYFVSLKNIYAQMAPTRYWSVAFWQPFPLSFNTIVWPFNSIFNFFKNPLGFELKGIASLFFFLGLFNCFKNFKKEVAWFLLLPGLTAYSLSFLHVYPFYGRMLFFYVPFSLLIIGSGVEVFKTFKKPLFYLSLAVLLVLPSLKALHSFLRPHRVEEIRIVLCKLKQLEEKLDKIYVYYGAIPAFKYYQHRYHELKSYNIFWGKSHREKPELYISELEPLKGTWGFIFAHNFDAEEKLFVSYLKSRGTLKFQFKTTGASFYLFEFSGNSSENLSIP